MKSPAMRQHDPNDDPFAALSSDFDSNMLTLPTEYGSGAIDPTASAATAKDADKKEDADSNKLTPPSSPMKDEGDDEALSPAPKKNEDAPTVEEEA